MVKGEELDQGREVHRRPGPAGPEQLLQVDVLPNYRTSHSDRARKGPISFRSVLHVRAGMMPLEAVQRERERKKENTPEAVEPRAC